MLRMKVSPNISLGEEPLGICDENRRFKPSEKIHLLFSKKDSL